MYSLVKNELVKILHKKGLYIYIILLLIYFAISIILNKTLNLSNDASSHYYENLESVIETYDLSNQDELRMYVGDKTNLETYKIIKNHGIKNPDSPEYYFVQNKISGVLNELYINQYIYKDTEETLRLQKELDKLINRLENYDWKAELLLDKIELNKQLNEDITEDEKALIKDQLLAIDYRINNQIPYSYSNTSLVVEDFISSASRYRSLDLDKKVLTRNEEINKQKIIKEYEESKYKIENNIVVEEKNYDEFIDSFTYVSLDIVVAILIICGGVVAEEFNKGTVKQLFVRPFTRSKILISKMIASFILLIGFIGVYSLINITALTIEGAKLSSLFSPIIVYNANVGKVLEYNVFRYILETFIAILPAYLFLFVVCFLVGVITTSTVGAIIVTLGVNIFPSIFTFPDKVAAYLPFNCMDYNTYLFGGLSDNQYQTFTSSFIVMGITFIVLNVVMFWVFNKKDVKNQ